MPNQAPGGSVIQLKEHAGGRLRSGLYSGSGEADVNIELFEALRAQKAAIEKVYSAPLTWEDLEG